MMKDPEDEATPSNLKIESSDEEPGHREPGQPKDFAQEPTIVEPNDGNDMRDGAMKDPEDEAAPSNLERNGKKNKKISVKLPEAALHSQPQPVRKVSRKKHFKLFSPTTDMNKVLDLTLLLLLQMRIQNAKKFTCSRRYNFNLNLWPLLEKMTHPQTENWSNKTNIQSSSIQQNSNHTFQPDKSTITSTCNQQTNLYISTYRLT